MLSDLFDFLFIVRRRLLNYIPRRVALWPGECFVPTCSSYF